MHQIDVVVCLLHFFAYSTVMLISDNALRLRIYERQHRRYFLCIWLYHYAPKMSSHFLISAGRVSLSLRQYSMLARTLYSVIHQVNA